MIRYISRSIGSAFTMLKKIVEGNVKKKRGRPPILGVKAVRNDNRTCGKN